MQNAGLAAASAPPFKDVRARLLLKLLPPLQYGRLRIVLPGGQIMERAGREPGPDATVVMHRWRAVWRLTQGGDVGFAEAFVDGDWSSPDLTAAIRLGARHLDAFDSTIRGSAVARIANRMRHYWNANSKRRSRQNIQAHYDLGNDFYRLWLDSKMLYSSAIWDAAGSDLERAQMRKLDRVRELLCLDGGDHVLEIGYGWGALAAHLVEDRQTRVTGLTLSPAQLEWARQDIAGRGLGDLTDLKLQDYRDAEGAFDRIVSIEMFEAVGEEYWPDYFATLARCLKPGGRAVLQVITIAEDRFEGYRNEADFIQKHIFPGGFLPSSTALRAGIENAGLRLAASETFGASYALTLGEWRRRFDGRWDDIAKQGFDDRFRRRWEYYLCYCEAGFLERTVNVGLYTIVHRSVT